MVLWMFILGHVLTLFLLFVKTIAIDMRPIWLINMGSNVLHAAAFYHCRIDLRAALAV